MRAGYITRLGRVTWDAMTLLALAWGGPFRLPIPVADLPGQSDAPGRIG